jgi:hypothetical protein
MQISPTRQSPRCPEGNADAKRNADAKGNADAKRNANAKGNADADVMAIGRSRNSSLPPCSAAPRTRALRGRCSPCFAMLGSMAIE